jgi:multiple sugar transport system substrate-binding protein
MILKNTRFKFIWYRVAILFMIILISSFFLPSCSRDKTIIKIAVQSPENKEWNGIINEFNSSNTKNIKIELVSTNDDNLNSTDSLRDYYLKSFKDHDIIDLVYTDVVWLSEYVEKGMLLPLSEYFKPDFLDEFLLSEVKFGKYKNELYRIPLRSDAGVLFYRKDLLKKLGISKIETFDDLTKTAQRLIKEEKIPIGYLWQGREYEGLTAMFVEVLYGHGGFWINDQRQVGLDRPAAIQSVKFLRSLIDSGISKGATDSGEEETRKKFRDGEVALIRNWPGIWANANLASTKTGDRIAIQPMVHLKGENSYACRGGWGLAVAKQSKHPDEAVEVIKFLTSVKVQRQQSLKAGIIPSRKNLFYDPQLVEKYDFLPELKEIIEKNGVYRPAISEYKKASEILQKYLHKVLTAKNNPNPEQAMKEAAAQTRKLLDNKKLN